MLSTALEGIIKLGKLPSTLQLHSKCDYISAAASCKRIMILEQNSCAFESKSQILPAVQQETVQEALSLCAGSH